MPRSYVGFGFGAIQTGLFLPVAEKSGNFDRLVVAEIDPSLVQGIRENKGTYSCNIAHSDRVEFITLEGVEILNPTDAIIITRLDNYSKSTYTRYKIHSLHNQNCICMSSFTFIATTT